MHITRVDLIVNREPPRPSPAFCYLRVIHAQHTVHQSIVVLYRTHTHTHTRVDVTGFRFSLSHTIALSLSRPLTLSLSLGLSLALSLLSIRGGDPWPGRPGSCWAARTINFDPVTVARRRRILRPLRPRSLSRPSDSSPPVSIRAEFIAYIIHARALPLRAARGRDGLYGRDERGDAHQVRPSGGVPARGLRGPRPNHSRRCGGEGGGGGDGGGSRHEQIPFSHTPLAKQYRARGRAQNENTPNPPPTPECFPSRICALSPQWAYDVEDITIRIQSIIVLAIFHARTTERHATYSPVVLSLSKFNTTLVLLLNWNIIFCLHYFSIFWISVTTSWPVGGRGLAVICYTATEVVSFRETISKSLNPYVLSIIQFKYLDTQNGLLFNNT